MAKRGSQFQTIRTEGAILPPDILRRIASLKVEGATPDAYHLPPGSKINEAISQSWTTLLNHWQAFQSAREQLPASDETGTAVTNERWLLPLFNELDYGRLVTSKSPEIDERVYSIERFYNHTPIHLIGCKLPLDRRTKGARGAATASPHSMVQEFLNRSEDHLWAFLSNGVQLRVLRDNVSLSRQTFVEFDLEAMFEGEVYADFALLWLLCHQSRVEADKPQECWLEQWSQLAREQGTRVLNDLRVGVAKAIEALGRGFIGHPRNDRLRDKLQTGALGKDDFYRQLLRVVYRLLFLFVAEDRELLHPPDASPASAELYDTHYSTRRLRELALKMRGTKHADLWHSLSLVFAALGESDGCPQLGLAGLGSFLWQTDSTADLLGPHQIAAPFPHGPHGGEGRSEEDDDVEPVLITNDDLLQAVRELAYVEQDRVLRTVDYRNLGSEELGSVYESLLELHPVMDVRGKTFELLTAAGNERKTTGSYYTPDSLVQCLLDSALDPVVEERLKGKKGAEAEQAILDMKVCDPACGSGHFLIAAAHRMARHLARIRTGEAEPGPEDYQHALRDVIGRCIYGVDINPMAVELCKVSLWMEAIEPGKPLSFLDHHIQCGNSLLGTTPALLAEGIPDDAFKPIEGDVKAVCNELKKQNKKERKDREKGQSYLFEPYIKLGNLPAEFTRLSRETDDSLGDVTDKERRYAELVGRSDYRNARLLADTWCAVFVWKKDKTELGKLCPTERDFRKVESHADTGLLPHVRSEVRRLAGSPENGGYQFFHWHLAFPDVFRLLDESTYAETEHTGWNGGFDVVLGNPPWDQIQFQEKEFFAERSPEIVRAKNATARKKKIAALAETDPKLFEEFSVSQREVNSISSYLRYSQSYPMCGQNRLNTYALFAELGTILVEPRGCIGLIVPSGIATDDTTRVFFDACVSSLRLRSLFELENRGFFPDAGKGHMNRFCLVSIGGPLRTVSKSKFAFRGQRLSEVTDPSRQFTLNVDDIRRLNPNTRTCPTFRSREYAELVKRIHGRLPVLEKVDRSDEGPWKLRTLSTFNMADDSFRFRTRDTLNQDGWILDGNIFTKERQKAVPLVESKMIHHFNHRFGDFGLLQPNDRGHVLPSPDASMLECPSYGNLPRYWITESDVADCLRDWGRGWLLGWRDTANDANSRTCICCVIPRLATARNNLPILFSDQPAEQVAALVGCLSSFACDFVVRGKLGGTHLTQVVMRQVPVISPEIIASADYWSGKHPLSWWIRSRVLELSYTAWNLEAFALDCGYDGPPFRWDEERRFLMRCELDAAYFHLYLGTPAEWGEDPHPGPLPEGAEGEGAQPTPLREMFPTPRDAVEYIMETFPIVKRKDIARTEVKNDAGEVIRAGRYITKETILEIYDEMQQAIDTGEPYQTKLNPPPGPPTDPEGNFIPMAEWDPDNWPSHIHKPRTKAAVS